VAYYRARGRLASNSTAVRRTRTRSARRDRWAVILAGGDGTRLRPLTRAIAGDDRPKQFCPILGNDTLLHQTQRRVSLGVPREQTMIVLTETHREFFEPLRFEVSSSMLLTQPSNLGTTPAILYSLMRLEKVNPEATVAFFPSDHYFADDAGFMSDVDSAFRAVRARSEVIVLLGIEADRPEIEYGWIEPAPSLLGDLPRAIRRVRRFWEKPSQALASKLIRQGCLWNSFVMVGQIAAFMKMIRAAVPEIFETFARIQPALGRSGEAALVREVYSSLGGPSNFSQEVLSTRPNDLSVLAVREVGWSDWGEPGRVLSTLARIGIQTEWAENSA
jgi:mannose-1-phosphate guanylyltransferase